MVGVRKTEGFCCLLVRGHPCIWCGQDKIPPFITMLPTICCPPFLCVAIIFYTGSCAFSSSPLQKGGEMSIKIKIKRLCSKYLGLIGVII